MKPTTTMVTIPHQFLLAALKELKVDDLAVIAMVKIMEMAVITGINPPTCFAASLTVGDLIGVEPLAHQNAIMEKVIQRSEELKKLNQISN